jgi:hypothetical protein
LGRSAAKKQLVIAHAFEAEIVVAAAPPALPAQMFQPSPFFSSWSPLHLWAATGMKPVSAELLEPCAMP